MKIDQKIERLHEFFPLAMKAMDELINTGEERYPDNDFIARLTQEEFVKKTLAHIYQYKNGKKWDANSDIVTHNLASAIFDIMAAYEFELRALDWGKREV